MTNGEMMLKAFPDMEIEKSGVYVFVWIEHEPTHFDVKWWDEEYKEPNHIVDAGKMMGSTNKNDLGVDLISRADVLKLMQDNWHTHNGDWAMQESMDDIRALPSVTPQEPQSFKWCTDCKEYDQEKHCCHRYSKVIRNTVAEIRQEPKTGHWIPRNSFLLQYKCSECGLESEKYNYCPNCGAKMVETQESEDKE